MKIKRIAALFLTGIFILAGSARAAEFEADMEVYSKGEKKESHAAFSTSGTAMKMRMEMVENNEKAVIIVRTDKDLSWMIMPSQKIYMENKIDRTKQWIPELNKQADAKLLRSEILDGFSCDVYESKDGDNLMLVWMAAELDGFPIKTESKDEKVTFKNIKKTELNPDLFEPPAGYEKMMMPNIGGMMKDMQGGY